ncbi:NADH-quinone oxidoreductase subunit NuoK [Seonamhaeicola sediminis]|uniref:NADH-quinone oxidoreductase subunit K n=1 Tax=Seonamhaeicola sediminis TaxID=2528206 RepID=A0A562YGR1_9FLAO|nr:NADH-quinone oxidoreductase subunit NuoK [Seonamhaeicola sediminis]TWO33716.1 NADH-quinone oxidoreductase subunit NuoK [Seonamhaeicola sediminis]
MIEGITIYEILTLTTIIFFIGVYGFLTRTNLISMLISVELILNASVVNFVIINKYLYPDVLQGVFFSIFIIAVAAAETALAISIIINLYRQISSVEVKDTEIMKY